MTDGVLGARRIGQYDEEGRAPRDEEKTVTASWNLDEPPVPDDATAVRLVFVRHGQSEWNARALIQGHEGGGLTPLGRAQGRAVADHLSRFWPVPRVVVTSDLPRSVETAQCYVQQVGFEGMRCDQRLREVDNGVWSGRDTAEVAVSEAAYITRIRHGEDLQRGGGESLTEAQERVADFTAELVAELAGQADPADRWALVFGHGGTIRLSALSALGLPGRAARLVGHPANTALTEIEYWVDSDGRLVAERLLGYNSAQHLLHGAADDQALRPTSAAAN